MRVKVSQISTATLFEAAGHRWSRSDQGNTAIWTLPGESQAKVYFLIHGFRGDHHGLAAIAAGLKKYPVLIPDLPGYGKSGELETHDVASYGIWLKELIEKQKSPVVLLGHSFGTLVCAAAIASGAKVEKLILVAPISTKSIGQQDIANKAARWFYRVTEKLGNLGEMLQRSALVVQVMSTVMATTKQSKLRKFIHTQHHKYFSNFRNEKVVQEGFWSAASTSVRDFAKDISVPTLIIAGERDLIAPLAGQVELSKELVNCELEVIPTIGHLLHYEAPEQVAKLTEEFEAS